MFKVLISTTVESAVQVATAVFGDVRDDGHTVSCVVDASSDIAALETVHMLLGANRVSCGVVRVWQGGSWV
jgi:hypothetical protein